LVFSFAASPSFEFLKNILFHPLFFFHLFFFLSFYFFVFFYFFASAI